MSATDEQLAGREAVQGYLVAAGLPRVRVKSDAEGWPIVPGALGRVEWQGTEADGAPDRLYVFTDRQIVSRLLEIPGVEKHQIGSGEARLSFLAADAKALEQVCRCIRARVRRSPTLGSTAEHMARIRPQRTPEPAA